MKSLKLLSAGLLALAVVASASASQIKITGSTAIRKALYAGIVRTLSADGTVYVTSCDPLFNNKTPDGAQQAVFVSVSGGAIVNSVQTCLSGSVGGIGYVVTAGNVQSSITAVGNPDKAWMTVPAVATITANWPTVTVNAGGTFTYAGGTVTLNGAAGNRGQTVNVDASFFDAAATASVCMSDSLQDSTSYDSVSWGNALSDTQEGTVTFTLVKGQKHPSFAASGSPYEDLTNISAQNFQALVSKGHIDLSQITGKVADAGVDVVLVGRNSDSGTRLGVFAETGVGPVTTGAAQYYPLNAGGTDASTGSGSAIASWTPVASDQDGYDSGAFVKQSCLDTIAAGAHGPSGASTFIEVAYVSMGDLPAASLQLTYNGVLASQANVIGGTYTLWTTEHFLYDTTAIAGADLAVVNNIKGNVTATNSNANYVNQGGLLCSRTGVEGSTVIHN
jgi:hypothetical protein